MFYTKLCNILGFLVGRGAAVVIVKVMMGTEILKPLRILFPRSNVCRIYEMVTFLYN